MAYLIAEIMVLKNLKGISIVFLTNVKMQKQREKRIFQIQRKQLSQVAPFQNKNGFLRCKIEELVRWYDEFTGMDEIRDAQKRVLDDEQRFRIRQEERRNVLHELNEIQNKIKELYAELDNTNRGEERYVYLVTQEHKLLKEEKVILEKFSTAEKDERDAFAALSNSVKLSHEKERAQRERTKYWSVIGSIMGTIIGILGTSINNHFRMNELKELIKNSPEKLFIKNLTKYLEANENLSNLLNSNENLLEKGNSVKMDELLDKLNSKLNVIEVSLNNIKETNQEINSHIVTNDERPFNVTVPIEVPEKMKSEFIQIKIMLCALVVLTIIMPVISNRYL